MSGEPRQYSEAIFHGGAALPKELKGLTCIVQTADARFLHLLLFPIINKLKLVYTLNYVCRPREYRIKMIKYNIFFVTSCKGNNRL